MKTVVTTRKDFQMLLKYEFVPYLKENGFDDFVKCWSREMFVEWTFFFYGDRQVYLMGNEKEGV